MIQHAPSGTLEKDPISPLVCALLYSVDALIPGDTKFGPSADRACRRTLKSQDMFVPGLKRTQGVVGSHVNCARDRGLVAAATMHGQRSRETAKKYAHCAVPSLPHPSGTIPMAGTRGNSQEHINEKTPRRLKKAHRIVNLIRRRTTKHARGNAC